MQLRNSDSSLRGSSEVEAVLIIKGDVDAVLKELADLRSILNYRLEPGQSKTIHDRYFDTIDRRLRKRGANLRIREIDGSLFISVKSHTRRTLRGATARREIEVPWSKQNLLSHIKDLELEADLALPERQFSDADPLAAMDATGLQLVQDRETRREVRNVSSVRKPDLVLAELAIDRVTYHIGNHNISIFEVEVEEKAKGSSSVISDLTKALLQAYQPSLQKWSHGKFVTGLAIQRLLETEPADNLLGQDRLKPEALGTIDRALRSTRKSWGQRLVRTLLSHR
ncbi:CYTH domain-containing protein [Candidatus Bathyarchaeota archaeon]|nr:MAG: CYTH domain-containing protein [Candidatus Bathyarchaeota archaeon]